MGLNQIDTVTQRNTASAEETTAAAQELLARAGELKDLLGRFQLGGGEGHALAGDQRQLFFPASDN